MSRSDQRRRRALRAAAPVAGLLAVGLLVWQGSTAAFSATTDNGSENWATGSLTLTNDGGVGTAASYAASTTALFNDTNLKIPTAASTKCLSVKAGGTTGGTLNFYRGAISGANSAGLAPQINVVIKASAVTTTQPPAGCAGFVSTTNVTPVAGVALSALPTTYATGLGAIAVPVGTQYVTYQITYNITSTGTNAGDNLLQSSAATAQFLWELQ
jgi:hypothetical protein